MFTIDFPLYEKLKYVEENIQGNIAIVMKEIMDELRKQENQYWDDQYDAAHSPGSGNIHYVDTPYFKNLMNKDD